MIAPMLGLRTCETFSAGDVLVGLWDHDRCRADWQGHLDMLDDRERRRLAAISNPRRATAFVSGRCCARTTLSQHIDRKMPADAWRIDVDATGRPWIAGHLAGGCSISISHADVFSVVALRPGPVGIDVEPMGRRIARDVADAATPLEALEAWTAKEARFKLDGTAETTIGRQKSAAVTSHVVWRSHLIAIATHAA